MSIFNQQNTWLGNKDSGSLFNNEFANLINKLNQLDAGLISWTNVSVTTLTPLANVAMGGFKLTGLGAGTASGDSARFGQIKLLQTVVNTSTSSKSSTSTSFVDTNLTIAITPTSASNRVLILACSTLEINAGTQNGYATIAAGGTNLAGSDGLVICATNVAALERNPATLVWVDSPAVTTSVTYSVQIKTSSNTQAVVWGDSANNSQIIVAMEIV